MKYDLTNYYNIQIINDIPFYVIYIEHLPIKKEIDNSLAITLLYDHKGKLND